MFYDNKIVFGDANGKRVFIEPKMANRHGIIAGATGTGKTITLKVLAESFSQAGVPVFLADVKGDLASLSKAGTESEDMKERIRRFNLNEMGFKYQAYPCEFWDIYGKEGIPLRTTVYEMGPVLLARLMNLNETQTELLQVVFKIADDEFTAREYAPDMKQPLIDIKDLKAMLKYIGENAKAYSAEYGNISVQSLNTITRNLVALEAEGAEEFFTAPALKIKDWFAANDGKGVINILDARQLMQSPTMYATFLLWMMSELFETLPEVGDPEKPRMIFFFDEAHLLFKNTPKAFVQKVTQVVKLIRSKGVGIYFISQSPSDIPDDVLSQLGNKIQHALRAYTPKEEKAVKAAAASFRANPAFDTREVLEKLGTGEALISVLDEKGIPTVVEKCSILPPCSRFGSISDEERAQQFKLSNLYLQYEEAEDPYSFYEFYQRRMQMAEEQAKEKAEAALLEKEEAARAKTEAKEKAAAEKAKAKEEAASSKARKKAVKSVGNSVAGTIGREVGNTLGKTVGGSFGKKLGGNLGASLARGILGTFLK